MRLASGLLCITLLMATAFPAAAQEQPVVYSQTIIGIVPGSAVPKAITQSPELQGSDASAEASTSDTIMDAVTGAAESTRKLRVEVRREQIPISYGMFSNYRLDAGHGVLTYFSRAEPRTLLAENIHKPLDVLFIRDDGVIAQIIPEIVMAYLPEDVSVDFPLRALLYMEAGLTAEWGIKPGYRVEHGMFTPKPMIYTVEEE